MAKASDIITEYLKMWSKSPHNDPTSMMVDELRSKPEETFNAIIEYNGPRYHIDPRDIDMPMGILLSKIADLVPHLFIPHMTEGFWGSRYMYIGAAAECQASIYKDIFVQLLTDRSTYIKTLILRLIIEWPHLQTEEMIPQLEKLRQMKSFQKDNMDKELLNKAFDVVLSNT